MSTEPKSPGMRAVEAIEVSNFHVMSRMGAIAAFPIERLEVAAIIDRETGVNELREQAEQLARALEDVLPALASASHYGGMFGSALGDGFRDAASKARAALKAYKEKR